MAIAFDAASSASGNSVSSLTWSHTCTGADLILIVGVSWFGSARTVSGVTYAGTALTSVGSANSGGQKMEIFRLVAPATGANNVVVTMSSAGETVAGAHSYTGVDSTTPLGTFASAIGGPTVDVTSATDEVVVDCASMDNLLTVGAGQTQRWNISLGGGLTSGAGSSEPGAATVTMSWSGTPTFAWSIGGVSMKPVGAGVEAALPGHGPLLADRRNRLIQHV